MSEVVLAHQFPVKINTGTFATPVWTEIKSFNDYTVDPQSKEIDTVTSDDAGWQAGLVVERGVNITVNGLLKEDDEGDLDAGFVALEGYANEVGTAAICELLVALPGGNGFRFRANVVSYTAGGGTTNEAVKYQVEFKSTGEITFGAIATID